MGRHTMPTENTDQEATENANQDAAETAEAVTISQAINALKP